MTQSKSLKTLVKASKAASKNNYVESISLCKKAISQSKNNIHAYKLLATSLITLKNFEEADKVIKKAIKIAEHNDREVLLHLLGCNYISLRDYKSALDVLSEAFNETGNSKILLDIALSYFNLREFENARDVYLKLLELEPNNHQAKFNLCPILLHFKDYKNAWVCFHSRLHRQEIIDQVHWFAPQWDGEPLVGKKILIYPEQGIGDNLSYTECFEEAIVDASETYIVCDNRLKALYSHNFPNATVLSYDDVNQKQAINVDFDCQILAGSLSYLYRETAESYINQKSLSIEIALLKKKNGLLSKNKLRVGVSWFHGRRNDGNEYSMYLEELLPALQIEGVEWVNLQFGDWETEVKAIKEKHGISITHIEESSAAGDFNQYGALIANLDIVIASSNAALMFASRLGVETWCFLPDVNQELQVDSSQDPLAIKNDRLFFSGNTSSWASVVEQFRSELLQRSKKIEENLNE